MVRTILLAEALVALVLAWLMVSILPSRRVLPLFGDMGMPAAMGTTAPPPDLARAVAVACRARWVADRLPWHSTCLVRALAGAMLLRRRRIRGARVRFGVRRDGGALAAHAWLLLGAETLLGGEQATEYRPLADLGCREGSR